MLIAFVVIIILGLIVAAFVVPNMEENKEQETTANFSSVQQSAYNLINIHEIKAHAYNMEIQEKLTKNEALYFSISSLCGFILTTKGLDIKKNIDKLKQVLNENYPNMLPYVQKIINKDFDFVEHIAMNARIIMHNEGKTDLESRYLAICMFYDDLVLKNSQQGITDLMQIVETVYPELFDEVNVYIAWRYNSSNLNFKPEFNDMMKRRHLLK